MQVQGLISPIPCLASLRIRQALLPAPCIIAYGENKLRLKLGALQQQANHLKSFSSLALAILAPPYTCARAYLCSGARRDIQCFGEKNKKPKSALVSYL